MKTLFQLVTTAAFAFASVAVHATPIGYSKLEGSKFNVYYAADSTYVASLAGNTLHIQPQALSAAVTYPGGFAELSNTLFIVAHDGVSLKSDFKRRFAGYFGLSPNAGFGIESVGFRVDSAIYASDFASEYVDYGTNYGWTEDSYRQFGGDYAYFDVVDSNAPWFPGSSASANDGFNYSQFALGIGARVSASSPSGMGAFASMDYISFSFETVETASDVPEPASLALLGIGALALMRRRMRK